MHPWTFSIAAVLFVAVLVSHAWTLRRSSETLNWPQTGLEGWILLYGILFGVSVTFSQIPYNSALEFYKLACMILVFGITVVMFRDTGLLLRLALILVFIGLGLSLFGFWQHAGLLPKGWWHKPRLLSATYMNHNHFAGLLEMTIPLTIGVMLSVTGRVRRIFLILALSVMGVAFMLSLSRGAWVALALALLIMLYLAAKRNFVTWRFWIGAMLLVATVGVVGISDAPRIMERFRSVGNVYQTRESMDRLKVWKGTADLIRQYPWLGSGPGTYEDTFLRFRPDGFKSRPGFAHNDYLHLLADCGILTFLAAIGFFLTLFLKGCLLVLRSSEKVARGLGLGCVGAVVAIGAHSVVDFNLHIPANAFIFAVVLGILVSLGQPRGVGSVLARSLFKIAAPLLALFVLIGSVLFGASDFFHWRAKRSLNRHDWEGTYQSASHSLSINPLNPTAYSTRGLSQLRRLPSVADRQAEPSALNDFKRAMELNAHEPYYAFHWASEYAKTLGPARLHEALPHFRAVLEKDPKAARLAFRLGNELLKLNRTHDPVVEEEALGFLIRSLEGEMDPVDVYQAMWETTRDIARLETLARKSPQGLLGLLRFLEKQDLWKYHRPYFLESLGVDFRTYDRLARDPSWKNYEERFITIQDFRSLSDKPLVKKNSFFRGGEIEGSFNFPHEMNRLIFRARSSKVGASYGYLIVKLDNRVVNAFYLGSPRFKDYVVLFEADPGFHALTLKFVNDRVDRSSGKDRNLWIERVTLQSRPDKGFL